MPYGVETNQPRLGPVGGQPVGGQPVGGPTQHRGLGIAVVDTVPIFREGVAALVHRVPGLRWAGHATNHYNALRLCEQVRPGLLLLDSALDPNCHLIKLLGSGDGALLILVLIREAQRTPEYLGRALAAGAQAAIPRAVEARRLIEAIRHAQGERRYLDPSLAALVANNGARTPMPRSGGMSGRRMPLSRREYQVLQLLAEGLENSAIARTLYLSVETVRTHVKNILRKLSARDRTHAVAMAFRDGILIARVDDELGEPPAAPLAAKHG